MAHISCEANDLLASSNCMRCIPPGEQGPVTIYLLQQIAGNTMTADQLLQAANCLRCIPPGQQKEIMIYLLCQIVNSF